MNDYELPAQTEFTGDVDQWQTDAEKQAQFEVEVQEQQQQTEQEQQSLDVAADKKQDSRSDNPEGEFNGADDYFTEIGAAISGGLQDTGNSLVTMPERVMDMFNGEMERENKTEEGYVAETAIFTDNDNPVLTHTWWGGALRGLVHFGSLAVGTVLTAKAGAVVAGGLGLSKVAGGLTWLGAGGAKATMAGRLGQGALIGGAGDVVSIESQKQNAMGALVKHYPALDNPLATKDNDHPAMKTLKSVVESMGIGAVADLAFEAVGAGLKATAKKGRRSAAEHIDARNKSVKEQTIEAGRAELKDSDGSQPMAHANKPILDQHQGNPSSMGDAADVQEQVARIRTEAGAEDGSTDSLVSAGALRKIKQAGTDMGDDTHEAVKAALSDSTITDPVKAAKAAEKELYVPLKQQNAEVEAIAQEIIGGRRADSDPKELFKLLNERAAARGDQSGGVPVWDGQDHKAAALVTYSLMKEVRNNAKAALEIVDNADVTDIGGPLDRLTDQLTYGLIQMNRSTKFAAEKLRSFQDGYVPKKVEVNKQEIIQSVETMKQVIKADTSDKALKQILDMFAQGEEITSMGDYYKLLRNWMKGEDHTTGALVKEAQGMITHSLLSGPKTPLKAINGTGTMAFLRPLSQALGASMRGDWVTAQSSLAGANAMVRAVPDAWKVFKSRLGATWSGDVSTINTRFSQYTNDNDARWEMFADFVENSPEATLGDKSAYGIASVIRGMNQNNFLTAGTKLMDAGDQSFNMIMARGKAAERHMREAIVQGKGVTKESISDAESRFLNSLLDENGFIDMNIVKEKDIDLYNAASEVTLTTDLTGFSRSIQQTMEGNPWTKPFFLFARTGINGLAMAGKHTPGVNLLLKRQRAIFMAKPDNLGPVMKYGIQNAEQLAQAKALALGRQSLGMGVIFMASQAFMNGNLRGSGPTDRKLRKTWTDAGYKRNTVRIGDAWVSFENIEPFNQILTMVADIGDHSQLMGPEWTQDKYRQLAMVVAEGITSKSYLASLNDMVNLVSGDPRAGGRMVGGLLNNTVPLASMRNELGKLFSPHIRELNSDIFSSIRNRNQLTELGSNQLPIKYDHLDGSSIKDQDFPTRMVNMFSLWPMNMEGSPGRELLFRSNYDLATSLNQYNGIDLSGNAEVRSEFQRLIGKSRIDKQLDNLAKEPSMILSIERMEAAPQDSDPMEFPHNERIKAIYDKAKKKAWAELSKREDVQLLIQEDKQSKARQAATNNSINQTNARRRDKDQEIMNLLQLPN